MDQAATELHEPIDQAKPERPHWKSPEARALRRQTINQRRNYFRQSVSTLDDAFNAAVDWLMPWRYHAYPGKVRGLHQIIGDRVSKKTIEAWRSHQNLAPAWAQRRLLEMLEDDIEAGREIAVALQQAIAVRPPRKLSGLQQRGSDGLPLYRNRVGRKQPADDAGSGETAEREI